jgi:hypothetical protein
MNALPPDDPKPSEPLEEARTFGDFAIYSFETSGPYVWIEPGSPDFPKVKMPPYPWGNVPRFQTPEPPPRES